MSSVLPLIRPMSVLEFPVTCSTFFPSKGSSASRRMSMEGPSGMHWFFLLLKYFLHLLRIGIGSPEVRVIEIHETLCRSNRHCTGKLVQVFRAVLRFEQFRVAMQAEVKRIC